MSTTLVKHAHRSMGHLGRESILSSLRQRYHLVKGSSLVRQYLISCYDCRKRHGKPLKQVMSDLPSGRVQGDTPAFTHVGLDYFGPFTVSVSRRTEKRYGVVFTCSASKAIHIEIAHSLNTDSFINALRKFTSRRENVTSATSDKGTNLTSGCDELKCAIKNWNANTIESWLKEKSVTSYFNMPAAFHRGGFFEREIRNVLSGLMNEQPIKLRDEKLSTLICEVESVLNNRPPNDDQSLTPNHLLLLNAGATFPTGLFNKDDGYVRRR